MTVVIVYIVLLVIGTLIYKGQKQTMSFDSKIAEEKAWKEHCRKNNIEYEPLFKDED